MLVAGMFGLKDVKNACLSLRSCWSKLATRMAITSLTYDPPVRRSTRRQTTDYGLLEVANALYEQGQPLAALRKVFEHLLPGTSVPDLAAETFWFTQGSSRVKTCVEGDDLVISVPLVRLPEGGKAIAALRFLLTEMSSTGQIYQPRLRGTDVHLEFRDRLSRLHPAKVVEVLRKMPAAADDHDDWIIGQFGALPLERAPIEALDDDEASRCERIWQSHWVDVLELVKECQRRRSMFFLNEVTAYAHHRIGFVLPLTGYLGARIEESGETFNDTHEDPVKREGTLAKCAKEMCGVSGTELRKSLGHATYAMSPLHDGRPALLSQYLGEGDYRDTIERLKDSGKSFEATLALVSTYYYLLRRYSWSEEIEAALRGGLSRSSGKPWREAATLLFEDASELVSKLSEDDAGGDDEDRQSGTEGDVE